MLLIYMANIYLIFWLEYRLEYHSAENVRRSDFLQDSRVSMSWRKPGGVNFSPGDRRGSAVIGQNAAVRIGCL